jgi:cytosine/adenosine deaminase-related metal-dependent hydrolase
MSDEVPWTLTARWVFPVDGPPLERGTVTIQGDKIAAVEPHGVRSADVDLGNAAILPGLVNAHTHLDLSGLRGKCPPTPDFTEWLRGVIQHRRSRTSEQIEADIGKAIGEISSHGTTVVCDIAANPGDMVSLAPRILRSVVTKELLGLPLDRVQLRWEEAVSWLLSRRTITLPPLRWFSTDMTRWGLSPHAPYSVNKWLFRRVADRARHECFPVVIHLAETAEEIELLQRHCGPFVQFLSELGVWEPEGLIEKSEQIVEMFSHAGPTLFIHCNYLDPATSIPSNGTIIYCPRTHAAFGHPPHPFREFLARGVRVALGTDSLASNPDLDILAEARFVHGKYPDISGATLLRMITLSGAEALGWADETGSLTPGKSADLVVLPLPDEERSDPYQLVLECALPVQKTLFRGSWRD